jgi:hypothetical protein
MIMNRSPAPQRAKVKGEPDGFALLALQLGPRDFCGGTDARFTGDIGAMSSGRVMSVRLAPPPDALAAG